MKRVFALLLALLLMVTGCKGKGKTNQTPAEGVRNVSVQDVSCPYEINHKNGLVELTLRDGNQRGILWEVQTVPEDICQVTQEAADAEYTSRYILSGKTEGAAQLTFTAKLPDETVYFALSFVVNVDGALKATVSSCQHQERKENVVEAEGLQYKWNVDIDGTLNFSWINQEDIWSVNGDGGDVLVLLNRMSTPVGCKFSAQAKTAGQTTIVLTGENTQRTIHVAIQADDQGNLEVTSVQEQ